MIRKGMVAVLIAVVMMVSGMARAHAELFSTPPGAQLNGLPVSVTAEFTLDPENDLINIVVNNLQANPKSVIQNLSDLAFVLSTGQSAGTLISSSGLERIVESNKSFIDGSSVSTGWALLENVSLPSGTGLWLNDLAPGAAGPTHTLIGPPGGDDRYGNANGSIAGNGPHNPFLAGPVTFTLLVPGIDNSTRVADVEFSYGTTSGNNVSVPEPTPLLLLGAGFLGMVVLAPLLRRQYTH